jgi:3-deoxy-D-manno-octulosonate 8-phosphate phosphatase (KDO 8-P phosphatase)
MIKNSESNILKDVQLLILDVDGVLTDGQIIISSDGTESKSFFVEDGTGAALANFAKFPLALLSGRYSKCTSIRAKELGIDCCIQGVLDKKNKIPFISEQFNIPLENIAYVGDGLVDIPVFDIVGVPISVPNADNIVKDRSRIITECHGGKGVLKELVKKILKSQYKYDDTLSIMKKKVFN